MILKGTLQDMIADIQQFCQYDGGRATYRLNRAGQIAQEDEDSPSGYRIDIIPLGREILNPPTENDEAVFGEEQIEIQAPAFFQFPQMQTYTSPKTEIDQIREEMFAMVDGIADIIESGKQGKDLADEIRKVKDK